jgi:hypothetical protein
MRGTMRLSFVALCLIVYGHAAWGQNGVPNQRDGYGNLVRNTGATPTRGVNQGPVNNGPIRNSPAQPTTHNLAAPKGANQ